MNDPFARRISSGKTLESVLFEPLGGPEPQLTIVDAGARNGMQIPASYARHACLVAFEPNPEEYQKLLSGTTDAQCAGMPLARFGAERYYDCALWSSTANRPFFVTAGTGACTLMGEASPAIVRRMWNDGQQRSYGEEHTDVRRTMPVECRRLDDVLPSGTLVDYLKLDVEGAELELMRGAQDLLSRSDVLFIKTEFQFTPYYKDHPVLGHQHAYLHDAGYRLIDLDLNHPRYSRDSTRIPPLADRRLIYSGDAFFIVDPDRAELGSEKLHRMGLAAIAHGFSSLGVSLLRDAGMTDASTLGDVESALANVRMLRRLMYRWNRAPEAAARLIARLYPRRTVS